MTYRRESREAAEQEARERTLQAASAYVEFRAALYPDGELPRDQWSYGVERWYRYGDRPDLGWILSGFVWDAQLGKGLDL